MEPMKGKVDAKAFAWDKKELPASFYLVPTVMGSGFESLILVQLILLKTESSRILTEFSFLKSKSVVMH